MPRARARRARVGARRTISAESDSTRRHRVVAAFAERVAAGYALEREPGPEERSVELERLDRVLAAGRREAVHRRLERRDPAPVGADRQREEAAGSDHGTILGRRKG